MTNGAAWMLFALLGFAAVWALEYHSGHYLYTLLLLAVFAVLRAAAWWNARASRLEQ